MAECPADVWEDATQRAPVPEHRRSSLERSGAGRSHQCGTRQCCRVSLLLTEQLGPSVQMEQGVNAGSKAEHF